MKVLMLLALFMSIAFPSFAQNQCTVNVQLNERYNNPANIGYRVANVGDLLRQANADVAGTKVLGLTLTINSQSGGIIAWKYTGNSYSGPAIILGQGRGSYVVNDSSWPSLNLRYRGGANSLNADLMDVNATGRGTVTAARLTLQGPACGGNNDGNSIGEARVSVSVDRELELRINQNGFQVLRTDGDGRTRVISQSILRNSDFRSIREVQVVPQGNTRVQAVARVMRPGRGNESIVVLFQDPFSGTGTGNFVIRWR